jgi:hypothetical protein
MVSGGLVCFGSSMLFHSFALWIICNITNFLAIGKLFMNKPGDSIKEFGVPFVGR